MLRWCSRCLYQRPPRPTNASSSSWRGKRGAPHARAQAHTPEQATDLSDRVRRDDRFSTFRPSRAHVDAPTTGDATAPLSGAAHLADRLRTLQEVDDNAPFDLNRVSAKSGAAVTSSATSSADCATRAEPWTKERESHPMPHAKHAPRRMRHAKVVTMMRESEAVQDAAAQSHDLAVFAEDDVIMDAPLSLRHLSSSPATRLAESQAAAMSSLKSHTTKQRTHRLDDSQSDATVAAQDVAWHPSARGVGQDVIDLVTDAFREQREAEVAKRRRVLYELTHPNPVDYSYNGKLVPPPPLNFGRVTEEAIQLGRTLLVEQPYSLVRRAGTRANAAAEHIPVTEANIAGMLEGGDDDSRTPSKGRRSGLLSSLSATAQPHRGLKREENIFRDHNFFFELNELYQEIVLVGKACAGKSSLLNALLDQNVAKTSSTPNTTRQISFYQSVTPQELRAFQQRERHNNLVKLPGGGRQLTFVDMPGFGIEGMSEKWRDAAIELTDAYFGVRRSVNTVLFCIDCERGLTAGDVKYFEWLENVQGVFYIVLTKCDSVSHTRLSSVMRQIYELITKKRRKFRKVFPFVIPTSAKTGANIDTLRGLITETSGIMPGDTLRDLLRRKNAATTQAALEKESQRLIAAREQARTEATQFFTAHRQRLSGVPTAGTEATAASAMTKSSAIGDADHGHDDANEDDVFVPLDMPASTTGSNVSLFIGRSAGPVHEAMLAGASEASVGRLSQNADRGASADDNTDNDSAVRRRRRAEFLQWRQDNPLEYEETPYGKVRFRLNTGLDNPLSELVSLETTPRDGAADAQGVHNASAPLEAITPTDKEAGDVEGVRAPLVGSSASAVIGLDGEFVPAGGIASPASSPSASSSPTGQVSRFLDAMEAYSTQTHTPRGRRSARAKEGRWRRHYAPRFLAEDGEGRLSEFTAGKKSGPSLVDPKSRVDRRKSEWKAQQLKALLQTECPDAPWSSLPRLTQKINTLKEEAGMTGPRMRKKDVAAYLKNAGRITESFEKFEGEVTAAKYMNETRQTKTLRSQQQMHLNATAKINYRSMPPGLWKEYGKKDTAWPTPRVLGRHQDESHRGQ